MNMAIEINKGIEAFDDVTDFTRGNKDRKPWGKGGVDALSLGDEYDVAPPAAEVPPVVPPVVPPPAAKITHKLANGTVLEAATFEELAGLIEKALQQKPAEAPVEFEDKPLYTPYEFKPKELSLTEQANILNVWKENPQKAMRMLQEADLGAPASVIIQKLQEAQNVIRLKGEEEAGAEFLGDHEDFQPSRANGIKLVEHLKTKGKPVTRRNLGIAFQQLVAAGDKSLLRKVDDPPVAEVDDPTLVDAPPPPIVVPSNQGLPEAPATEKVDAGKFAALSLNDQKKFFDNLKRRKAFFRAY